MTVAIMYCYLLLYWLCYLVVSGGIVTLWFNTVLCGVVFIYGAPSFKIYSGQVILIFCHETLLLSKREGGSG